MSKKGLPITDEQARAALERIEAEESTVAKESRALGLHHNTNLRNAIISLIGKERYFEVISRKGKKKTWNCKGCNPIPVSNPPVGQVPA